MTRLLRITGFLLIGSGVPGPSCLGDSTASLYLAVRSLHCPLPSRSELERPRWV